MMVDSWWCPTKGKDITDEVVAEFPTGFIVSIF